MVGMKIKNLQHNSNYFFMAWGYNGIADVLLPLKYVYWYIWVQKTLSVTTFLRLIIAVIENITFGNNSHSSLKLYHERDPWFVLLLL